MNDEERPLTEKQEQILKAYEAGGTTGEVADRVGTTKSAVDSTIYVLRKRGLVKRAKSAGGRRPKEESKPKPPARPKVRSAKVRVQSAADVRANKALSRKEERAALSGLSAATKDMIAVAKARIVEIDATIAPYLAEKERLAEVVALLKG